MERKEYRKEEIKIQSIEDAVEYLIGSVDAKDLQPVIDFLRKNKSDVSEFCLQVKDRYAENDTASVALELGRVIEALI